MFGCIQVEKDLTIAAVRGRVAFSTRSLKVFLNLTSMDYQPWETRVPSRQE